MKAPTITLVGCDSLRFEKIRASLAGSPFCLRRVERLPGGEEADLAVAAVELLAGGEAGRPPIPGRPPTIAWGPPGMMRAAFLAGCVDYLREPWTPEELALRAEAALARRASSHDFPWGRARWEGDTLCTPGGTTTLTRQQAVILRALLCRRGSPVPRAALAALLGSPANRGRGLDVQVSEIRRRVRVAEPGAGRFIVGVRGQGYLIP